MAVVIHYEGKFPENEVLKSDKPVLLDFGNVVRSLPHGFADRGRDRKRA